MNFTQFLDAVIDEGIESVKAIVPEGPKQRGAVRGFKDCRGATVGKLAFLLGAATVRTADYKQEVHDNEARMDDYWEARYRELQIEWVCNVVSALLLSQKKRPLSPLLPTARGVLMADKILKRRNGR